MIKYSVIGTSWITKSFIDGASLCPDLILDGIFSRSVEKGEYFKNETGALRVFTSFEELLKSDTELVYVASPNVCHYFQCKSLLENGKHIICEKPITITEKEFTELLEIANKNNLIYFEAIMYMHSKYRDLLKNAVKDLGIIKSASFDFSQLSSKYQALKNGELPNIFNPEMKTGALNDLGIYCVYPVIDIFGEPTEIIPCQHFLETGADDCGSAIFKYSDKLVTITYSKIGQSRGVSQIFGDEGTITIGSISQTDNINFYNNKGEKFELVPDIDKKYHMANEAFSSVEFIKNPHSEHYIECCEKAKVVLRCMEKMRVKK